jgi:uncharacterized protein
MSRLLEILSSLQLMLTELAHSLTAALERTDPEAPAISSQTPRRLELVRAQVVTSDEWPQWQPPPPIKRKDPPMKQRRGFALLSPEARQAAARLGGQKAQQGDRAHRWTPEEAREMGRRGGLASAAKRRAAGEPFGIRPDVNGD